MRFSLKHTSHICWSSLCISSASSSATLPPRSKKWSKITSGFGAGEGGAESLRAGRRGLLGRGSGLMSFLGIRSMPCELAPCDAYYVAAPNSQLLLETNGDFDQVSLRTATRIPRQQRLASPTRMPSLPSVHKTPKGPSKASFFDNREYKHTLLCGLDAACCARILRNSHE